MVAFWAAFTCVAACGLTIAEYYRTGERTPRSVWVLKPLASTGFLLTAAATGTLGHGFGRWVFAALLMCFLGDILLIPRTKKTFMAGMFAFLGGHAAFGLAFGQQRLSATGVGAGAFTMAIVSVCVALWLWPHVRRRMQVPLVAYMVAITAMVSLACGAWGQSQNHVLLAAAVLFAVSDILIARDRFKKRAFINRAIALPLYYASQLLFAVAGGT